MNLFIFNKEYLEVRRQVFHLIFGLSLCLLISADMFDVFFFSLLLFASLISSFVSKFTKIPLISFLLTHFERPKDAKRFPGKGFITFLVGAISSYLLFAVYFDNRLIALVSLLSLTIADSFSSLYGNTLAKYKNPLNKKKSLEGPIFALIFLIFTLRLFLPFFQTIIISIIAVLIELVEIRFLKWELDDNIYIPLVVGSLILILNYIF